jgi:3-oxoacid CoA-transferase B subunit
MGGAMDLVAGCQRVVVTMQHCAKFDTKKILKECTMPLTGVGVVDLIITELAVFEVSSDKGLRLIEKHPDVTVERIREVTDAPFEVSENLIDMQQ